MYLSIHITRSRVDLGYFYEQISFPCSYMCDIFEFFSGVYFDLHLTSIKSFSSMANSTAIFIFQSNLFERSFFDCQKSDIFKIHFFK